MAITFVQAPPGAGAGSIAATTVAATFASALTPGNLIVVGVSWDTSSGAGTTSPVVTDSVGNTYVEIPNCKINDATHNQGITAFYARNINGGPTPTVTATWSVGVTFRRLVVAEYAGVDQTTPLDKSLVNLQPTPGTGADGASSGTVATTANGELVWSFTMGISGNPTQTAGTGFTKRSTTSVGAAEAGIEDLVQSTAGNIAGTWTYSTNTAAATSVATFKPQTGTLSSRAQDVRLTAIAAPVAEDNTFGQSTFGILSFGGLGTPSNVSYAARITGRNTTNVAFTARLTGSALTSTTQTTAITSGASSSLTLRDAALTGQATTFRINDARLTAGVPTFRTQDARETGQAQSSVAYDARLTASSISSAAYDARQTGAALNSRTQDARVTALGAPFQSWNARQTAQLSSSVAYSSNIIGTTTSNRTQDVRVTGRLTSQVAYDARLTSQLGSLVTYDIRATGQAATNVSYSTRITSQASSSIAYDIRITGQFGASTTTLDVRLTGVDSTTVAYDVSIVGQLTPQAAVPIADNFTGMWGFTPLWPKLDVLDVDFIESGLSPVIVDVCEVQLGPLNDPLTSEAHILRYVYDKSAVAGDRIDLVVRLMQGTTQIAAWSHADIEPYTEAEHTLTGTEADSITNYSDLRLRFEAVKV